MRKSRAHIIRKLLIRMKIPTRDIAIFKGSHKHDWRVQITGATLGNQNRQRMAAVMDATGNGDVDVIELGNFGPTELRTRD